MLTTNPGSHLDHVPTTVVKFVLEKYRDRSGSFIDCFVLPEDLPTLESALYGPACGDPPVGEDEVQYAPRPGRAYPSRLVDRPKRSTRSAKS